MDPKGGMISVIILPINHSAYLVAVGPRCGKEYAARHRTIHFVLDYFLQIPLRVSSKSRISLIAE